MFPLYYTETSLSVIQVNSENDPSDSGHETSYLRAITPHAPHIPIIINSTSHFLINFSQANPSKFLNSNTVKISTIDSSYAGKRCWVLAYQSLAPIMLVALYLSLHQLKLNTKVDSLTTSMTYNSSFPASILSVPNKLFNRPRVIRGQGVQRYSLHTG